MPLPSTPMCLFFWGGETRQLRKPASMPETLGDGRHVKEM